MQAQVLVSATLLLLICTAGASNCSTGCSQCLDNSTQCAVECNIGWYNNSGGQCEYCGLHCHKCTRNGCYSCAPKFVLQGTTCKQQEDQDQVSKYLLIAVGGTIGLAILICCTKQCCQNCREERLMLQDQMIRQQNLRAMQRRFEQARREKHAPPLKLLWHFQSVKQTQVASSQECSICLHDGVLLRIACGHWFHLLCLANWSRKKNSCSNCQQEHLYPLRHYCLGCKRQYTRISDQSQMRCVYCNTVQVQNPSEKELLPPPANK